MKKKVVSIVLVVMLIMSICAGALADSATLKPGKAMGPKVYNISSSPSYKVTAAGRNGDKVKVQLDLYDNNVNSSNANDPWKKSFVGTYTISNYIQLTIKPRDFKFVAGRTPKARLRIWALSTNKDSIDVSRP